MGKNKPSFERHIPASVKVQVTNASQLLLDSKKMRTKEYTRYTGYPSGLRKEPLGKLIEKKGHKEALRRAVYGLPANKLRDKRMKNLFIEN